MKSIRRPALTTSEVIGMGCRLEYIADFLSINSLNACRELIQMNSVVAEVVRNSSPYFCAQLIKSPVGSSCCRTNVWLMIGQPATWGGSDFRRGSRFLSESQTTKAETRATDKAQT